NGPGLLTVTDREKGCAPWITGSATSGSYEIPYPPRIEVRPSPDTSQANPTRGPKVFHIVPYGNCGSDWNTIPLGAVGYVVDCTPGINVICWPASSFHIV